MPVIKSRQHRQLQLFISRRVWERCLVGQTAIAGVGVFLGLLDAIAGLEVDLGLLDCNRGHGPLLRLTLL